MRTPLPSWSPWTLLGIGLLMISCASPSTRAVANVGPAGGDETDPFTRIRDRTALVGHEFGICSTDADCVVEGCDRSVCAPPGETSTCVASDVATCLATIDPNLCGCHQGACRWARTAPTLMCSSINMVPGTRPATGTEPGLYPMPPH